MTEIHQHLFNRDEALEDGCGEGLAGVARICMQVFGWFWDDFFHGIS